MHLKTLVIVGTLHLSMVANTFGQGEMKVHFIDVGQGDATLIEFPNGVMLVDAGGEEADEFDGARNLLVYLKTFFERRRDLAERDYPIDLLAITHPHKDHTRAIPSILDDYTPANIIHNHQRSGSGGREQRLAIDMIRETEIDGYYIVADRATATGRGITNGVIDPFGPSGGGQTDPKVSVLWGGVRNGHGWDYDDLADENNHSLVIRVDFGDASLLFTGDLEEAIEDQETRFDKAGIERVVAAYKDTNMLDVYQVGHHGSANGGTDQLMQLISPMIAIISCGPPVRRRGGDFNAFNFGHPRKQTIDELESVVSANRTPKDVKYFERIHRPLDKRIKKSIYCTGWDGTIVLSATAGGDWSVEKLHGNPAFDAAMDSE